MGRKAGAVPPMRPPEQAPEPVPAQAPELVPVEEEATVVQPLLETPLFPMPTLSPSYATAYPAGGSTLQGMPSYMAAPATTAYMAAPPATSYMVGAQVTEPFTYVQPHHQQQRPTWSE